jgi:hypothetical protein
LEVPQPIDDALAIEKKNGNTFWADIIAKEMKNVRVAFKILENGEILYDFYDDFLSCLGFWFWNLSANLIHGSMN